MKIGIFHDVKKLMDDHGPTIACAGAVVCLGMSLYAAFKASKSVVKARETYEQNMEDLEAKEEKTAAEGQEIDPEAHKTQVHKYQMQRNIDYIFAYKWAGLFGLASIALMFTSCHMSGTAIAGLTAACAAKEDKIKQVYGKVKEKIGEEKLDEIKTEILQENAEKNMPRDSIKIDPSDIKVDPAKEGDDGKPPFEPGNEHNIGKMTVESLIYDDDLGCGYEIPKWQLHDAEALAYEMYAKNGEKLTVNELRGAMGITREELLEIVSKEMYARDNHRGWNADNPFKGYFVKPIKWHDLWIGALTYPNDPVEL